MNTQERQAGGTWSETQGGTENGNKTKVHTHMGSEEQNTRGTS